MEIGMDAEANITMPPMTKNAQAIKKSRSNASFDSLRRDIHIILSLDLINQ